jgi:hypothetical protein
VRLDCSRFRDNDLLRELARGGAVRLDFFHEVHAVNDLAEDDVGAVQPGGDNSGNEELGAVGILASVGHGQKTRLGVLDFEVLISELLAVNGLATGAIALGEVTTLEHETGDHTVETRSSVAKTMLAGGELAEVAGGLGDDIVVKLEDDAPSILAIDGDIELLSNKKKLISLSGFKIV